MFKIKYKQNGKNALSPKSFRTKALANRAIANVQEAKKRGIVHYKRYTYMRVVKK